MYFLDPPHDQPISNIILVCWATNHVNIADNIISSYLSLTIVEMDYVTSLFSIATASPSGGMKFITLSWAVIFMAFLASENIWLPVETICLLLRVVIHMNLFIHSRSMG